MAAELAARFEALEDQAERIMGVFARAGYERVAPSFIQPAEIFLDRIGEALRNRTYVFTDPDGQELCLRPDLTIPAARIYMERNPQSGAEARYCYNGPVFRYQPGEPDALRPREHRQAGLENFGAADREQADAEVLSLVLEAVRLAGLRGFAIRCGDLGLFRALLDALPIPARWRHRLMHGFWRQESFHQVLRQLARPAAPLADKDVAALAASLDPADRLGAEQDVAAFIEARNIALLGARNLGEITERLLAAAADMREQPLSPRSSAWWRAIWRSPARPTRRSPRSRPSPPRPASICPARSKAAAAARRCCARPTSPPAPCNSPPISAASSNIIPASSSRSNCRGAA